MTLTKLTLYSFVYVMQISRLVFCKYPLITCTFPKKCKKKQNLSSIARGQGHKACRLFRAFSAVHNHTWDYIIANECQPNHCFYTSMRRSWANSQGWDSKTKMYLVGFSIKSIFLRCIICLYQSLHQIHELAPVNVKAKQSS